MQNFTAIAFLFIGGIIAWFMRKLIFEKDTIPLSDFSALKDCVHELESQKAVAVEANRNLKEKFETVSNNFENKNRETDQLRECLAAKIEACNSLENILKDVRNQSEDAKTELQRKIDELTDARNTIFDLKAQIQFKQEKLDTQKTDLENLGKKFEDTFKVLAQNILDDKSKSFSAEQEKNLKGILEPLQKEIVQFKDEIGTKQKQESDERISLREQVKHMSTLNQTLSDQANKLTETLRLQVKQQGDWGESILEAILENSGLQKDLQYFTQQSSRNDEGKTIRPDVVISYPDGRKIIIDSKVSLTHYYNVCNSENEEEEKACLKQLIQSIKNHIEGLASKNYGDISQALDFIIMFVPVETAYIAAMHGDPGLWQYAYKKSILLISPANLIATLTLVKDMWRKDAVDKNAHEIADKAGKLYDKLVGFVETFEKVGVQLDKAGETWTEARKQLTAGKGNLISQALRMNALKINSRKELPDDLGNEGILNDHFSITQKNSDSLPLFE
jgi:DNA recombination protein RmuC